MYQNKTDALIAPAYRGNDQKKKEKKKPYKGGPLDEDDKLKDLMAELGFGLGDDRNIMPAGNPYMNSMQPGAQNMYGPAQMQQMPMPQMPMQQIPMQQYGARNMMPPNGNNSQVSISYISPEGITYNMGFTAPHEKRGDALYTSLCGLYGLMMTEGKMGSGKKAGGKYDGSKGYSGSSKGYSGGKGGSN